MSKSKFNYVDFSLVGLGEIFSRLISYSKAVKAKANAIMKGVNPTNITRKVRRIVKISMKEQGIDVGNGVNRYLINSFRVYKSANKEDKDTLIQKYKLDSTVLNGRGGDHVITKRAASKNTWSIKYKSILTIFMYGRKAYNIPGSAPQPGNKRPKKMLVWDSKKYPGKRIFWNWRVMGKLRVPAYKSVDYMIEANQSMEQWLVEIQDKFLNLGKTP